MVDLSEFDELPVEDYAPNPEAKPASPETDLWCAVIHQAWEDAFIASDWVITAGEPKTVDPEIIRGDARRFLTADIDPWRSDREDVCARAGIEPDFIQTAARKRLEAARDADSAREDMVHAKTIARMDKALAALLGRSETLSDRQMDSQLKRWADIEAMAF